MDNKPIFALMSIAWAVATYVPYFYSIFRGTTRPHLFSWIVWSIAGGVTCVIQCFHGAGPGAWVTGMGVFISSAVAVIALWYGERTITRGDWIALTAALAGIPLWLVIDSALGAVILESAVNVIGCYPTMRKSWSRPRSENLFMWSVTSAGSLLTLLAMQQITAVTMMYPATNMFSNAAMVVLLIFRRVRAEKLPVYKPPFDVT